MDAAGDDKAQDITNSNEISKKIFRARKTMTASCRQQMVTLSKIINVSKMENSGDELLNPPTEEAVQHAETETMCETNCIAQENSTEIMPIEGDVYNGLTLPTDVVQDDSGLNSGNSCKNTWEQNEINENTTSAARSPAHLSHTDSEANDGSGNPEKHQQSDLGLISSVGESNLPTFDATKDCSQINIDNYGSESTTVRNIDEDNSLNNNSAVVTPMDIVYGDSGNAAVPSQETNTSSTIDTSNAVTPNTTLDRLANFASNEFAEDSNSTSGNLKRKQTFSEDGEDSKRAKTSNKSLLDEIHNIIEGKIQTVFKESFDQRIQDLSQQICLIQSKGHHADSIAMHVKRIRRLGKRIKNALEFQNAISSASSKLRPVSATCDKEPLQTQPAIISPTTPSTAESTVLQTENNSAQNLSTHSSNLVVLSDESGQPSNPEKDPTGNPKSPSKKLDNEAIRKILESIKEHRKKTLSSRVAENGKTIIDLTDDEEQKSDKESKTDETVTPLPISVPAQDDANCPQKSMENKEVLADNKNECSRDVNELTSSVPKSTQTAKAHDSGTSVQMAPNPDPCMLKPPQKPELRLAQVQNPKGIALSWNIIQVDPICAPAKVYCLYVNQENPNSAKKLWKKIGEIKALPLPMACTLTQFVDDATYSFALRAKDAFGRFGPLCDIQSTTLKSLTTLKKI